MTPGVVQSPPASTPDASDLMERAVARLGSPADVARRLGVTPSHVSRLRKGTAGLSAMLSLRLADLLGVDRAFVLRVAGHDRLRALIFRGHDQPPRVQDAIDRLPPEDRRLVQTLIDRLLFLEMRPAGARGVDAPKGGAR